MLRGEYKIEWTAFVNVVYVNLRITRQVICGSLGPLVFVGKSSVWCYRFLCSIFVILRIDSLINNRNRRRPVCCKFSTRFSKTRLLNNSHAVHFLTDGH